ncbi:MAG: multicopper oxidase family protein [Chloroflexota bacterium]|nr:multicopper oxidase family protein [Chloroflexota bacterium]
MISKHDMHHTHHEDMNMGEVADPFSRDTTGLPDAIAPEVVVLQPDEIFELRAEQVRKRIGETTVKMLAYNRSIPGPTLKVAQGSEVTIHFSNDTDLDSTVHWHGLRLDNRFDGVPEGAHQGMMAPVPIGGSFTYHVRFPDPGLYWYHPHMREDYTQEMGLYGPILVVPTDAAYWSPVNREITFTLDDILLEEGKIAPFSRTLSDHTAMGRFGNVMLVNGETSPQLSLKQGEVVRLYLVNTANVRVFNVRLPGARMKLVGGDNGRVEREEFVEEVLLSPSERGIVDVFFEHAGQFSLEHRTPEQTYPLATVIVQEQPNEHSFAQEFSTLRTSPELEAQRVKLAAEADRQPDKTLNLVAEMPGMEHHGGGHHVEAIEWEDTMEMMNRMSTPQNMFWKLVDDSTGAANHDIDWSFTVGDQVKVRIVNAADSDHPMQHPIHFHGQRFLVLSRDGIDNENLAWKDTVLVPAGQTVDILVEMSNPGAWMVHCHIAEHLESGMMFTYHVHERGV